MKPKITTVRPGDIIPDELLKNDWNKTTILTECNKCKHVTTWYNHCIESTRPNQNPILCPLPMTYEFPCGEGGCDSMSGDIIKQVIDS